MNLIKKAGLISLLTGALCFSSSAQEIVDLKATDKSLTIKPKLSLPVNLSLGNDYLQNGERATMLGTEASLSKSIPLQANTFIAASIAHRVPFSQTLDNYSPRNSSSFSTVSALKTFNFANTDNYAGIKYHRNLRTEDSSISFNAGTSFSPIKDTYFTGWGAYYMAQNSNYRHFSSGTFISVVKGSITFSFNYYNAGERIENLDHSFNLSVSRTF